MACDPKLTQSAGASSHWLEAGQSRSAVLDQILFTEMLARLEYNQRLWHFTPAIIGYRYDGTLENSPVRIDRLLNLD